MELDKECICGRWNCHKLNYEEVEEVEKVESAWMRCLVQSRPSNLSMLKLHERERSGVHLWWHEMKAWKVI